MYSLVEPLVDRVLELVLGHIPGWGERSPAKRAADELLASLLEPMSPPTPDNQRLIGEILHSLEKAYRSIDEMRKKYGASVARNTRDGNLTVAGIAYRLQAIMRSRLNHWVPKLDDHMAGMPNGFKAAPWEARWAELADCRRDLDAMRVEARPYLDTLAGLAGDEEAAKQLPKPPNDEIERSSLAAPITPRSRERPKRSMVRWLDPAGIPGHVWSTRKADQSRKRQRGGTTHEPLDMGHLAARGEAGSDELWVDYVADMGDAIDPTLAVAWQLAEPTISLPTHERGELPEPPPTLPRGRLLVMGGDQVYPHASKSAYENQLVLPYRLAGDPASHEASSTEPGNEYSVVAIPGNHDWLGGIEHFEDLFCTANEFAEHWQAPQKQRYWALKLIGGWWMWGIDTGLDDQIDDEQQAFFAAASEELKEGDQVVVCAPVPFWQLKQKRPVAGYEPLRELLDGWIGKNKASAPIWLAGDSHFFAHYRRVTGRDEHHITAGGGGAFLQPTHNLVEQAPAEDDDPLFKLGARWPRPIDSRNKAASLAGLSDPQFRLVFVLFGLLHSAYAALVARSHNGGPAPGQALRWVLRGELGWIILALMFFMVTFATVANSVEKELRWGARTNGAIHGLAHCVLMVLVAAGAREFGGGKWWWLYVVAPLIGGFATTALLVSGVRLINRRIKANDTLAYSPAHQTGYKHFVRMRFSSNGDLSIYVIGIDPIGKGWYEALTGLSPQNLLGRLLRTSAQVRPDPPSLPPSDDRGARPHLHYVWGLDFDLGSESHVRHLQRTLGETHPETIRARSAMASRQLHAGEITEAVAAHKMIVHHDGNERNRSALADALVACADVNDAIEERRLLIDLVDIDDASASAAARVRYAAAVSSLDRDASAGMLKQWAGVAVGTTDEPDGWRSWVVELLENSARHLDGEDRALAELLSTYWNDPAWPHDVGDFAGDGLSSRDHRLARRLAASRFAALGRRDEALDLLCLNSTDRLSLFARRRLALDLPNSDVRRRAELETLRDEARQIVEIDRGFEAQFLVPVWIDLSDSFEASGKHREAQRESKDCWRETAAPHAHDTAAQLDPAWDGDDGLVRDPTVTAVNELKQAVAAITSRDDSNVSQPKRDRDYAGKVLSTALAAVLTLFGWTGLTGADNEIPVLEGSAANTIAVFPFDGEVAPNYAVSGLVASELADLPGWQVAGPSWVNEPFPDGDVDEVNRKLAERNIGLAIYGTADKSGLSVKVWLTPAVQGATLAGVIGPLELCCTPDPGKLSNGGRADLVRQQARYWIDMLEYLEVLHNVDAIECGELADCDNAATQLKNAADQLLAPIVNSPTVSSEVRNLARAFTGSTLILRRTFTPAGDDPADPLLTDAEKSFQSVLDDPTASASIEARVELTMARVILLRAGCGLDAGDTGLLDIAGDHIRAAEALAPDAVNLDPIELELRIGIASSGLAMCRTSFGLAEARDTLNEFDDLIGSYESQNDAVLERLALLMPSSYLQRGQLRDLLGEPGADLDYAKAVEHSPRIFRRFYRDQETAAAAARAVRGVDENNQDDEGDVAAESVEDDEDEPNDEQSIDEESVPTADEEDGDSFGVDTGRVGTMSGDTVEIAAPVTFASGESGDLPTRQVIYSAAALSLTNGFDCQNIRLGAGFYGAVTRAGRRVIVLCVPVDNEVWEVTVVGPNGDILVDGEPTLLRPTAPCCGPQILFELDASAGPYTIRAHRRSDGAIESTEFFLPPLTGVYFQSVYLAGAPHLLISGFPDGPLELTAFTVLDKNGETRVMTLGDVQPFVVDVKGITLVPVATAGATSTCVIPSDWLVDRSAQLETRACFIADVSEESVALVTCSIAYPHATVGERTLIRAVVTDTTAVVSLDIDDGAGRRAPGESTLLAQYDEPGTYTPTVAWSTADGLADVALCDPITVSAPFQSETLEASADASLVYSCSLPIGPLASQTQGGYVVVVELGERVDLDFYADGVVGPDLTLQWNHGNGTTDNQVDSFVEYNVEGVYPVSLTWQGPDDGGTIDCGTVIVGYPPNSLIGFRCWALPGFTVRVDEPLELQSGMWLPVSDATLRWDLGNGVTAAGASVTTSYSVPGEYPIRLLWERGGESGAVACANAIVLGANG